MDSINRTREPMFRLWIATYVDWRPMQWNQTPPRATAMELVEDTLFSADKAALFLEGFNRSVLHGDRPIWAVAVPITVRYEGDAQVGMPVEGYTFALDGSSGLEGCAEEDGVPQNGVPQNGAVGGGHVGDEQG